MADSALFKGRVETVGREQIGPRRLSSKSPFRHLDLSLILVPLALAAFGCVAIFSSTRARLLAEDMDPTFFVKRQLAALGLALVLYVACLLFDYRQLRELSPLVFGGCLLLLVAVLTPLGQVRAGAQRWIDLGPLQVQPAELMKIGLIVGLAALYAGGRSGERPARMAVALAATGIPAALVYLQPDLGTAMVLFAILFSILLVAGTRARWLLLLVLGGVAAFVLVLQLGLLRDYQVARLTAFLDERADPQRAGYNLAQSKIAIGSGGLNGKGLFRGTQTNLDYVPEQHTDFIFTAIGEETGFAGGVLLVALFGLLAWRFFRIALLSRDRFGALLAAGAGGMLVFQVFVNIGMTVGIMPITGIPLPFVSYGGSSLITSFLVTGILTNVHMRRFL